MSEKTTLLPTAPTDGRFIDDIPPVQVRVDDVYHHSAPSMTRIVIVPGLEFDPSRKFKYGLHSLAAAALLLVSFALVEFRSCAGGPFIDLEKLQALHVCLMVFAFVLYLLSLFGIADFVFQYKLMFSLGVLLIYTVVGLMVWMTYEAATNPCSTSNIPNIPVDLSFDPNKNVFNRGDGVGIIVLLIDIFATIFMISAATSFCKRY